MPRKFVYVFLIVAIAVVVASLAGDGLLRKMQPVDVLMCTYLFLVTIGFVLGIFGNNLIRPGMLGMALFGVMYFFALPITHGSRRLGFQFSGIEFTDIDIPISLFMVVLAGLVSQLLAMLLGPSQKRKEKQDEASATPQVEKLGLLD